MDIKEMLRKQREAKTTPSKTCEKSYMHEFEFTCHADGRDFYTNYFTCKHCGEMVKQEHERAKDDLMRWS